MYLIARNNVAERVLSGLMGDSTQGGSGGKSCLGDVPRGTMI